MPFDFVVAKSPIRLAVIDFVGEPGREFSTVLREAAKSKGDEFELIDDDLAQAAASGAGYGGSLNLSRDEARALGQSLGCDFYVLGKTLVARRLIAVGGEQFYFEALAGMFFVETRTGKLVLFSFESAKAQSELQAKDRLREILKLGWPRYAEAMIAERKLHLAAIENFQPIAPTIEVLTDDLAETGVERPFFFQRIKPDYTEQADLANVTATVELEAVFRADGTVGEVEVVKWAGFGLDESAVATVKKLRFKSAERNGKKLTLKGLVRYNFRRPQAQADQTQDEKKEEIERLKRSLRDIKKPPTQNP
ncbi:MAG: energy transducer TonB [Acidobacteria bacterium]|nr:energy transducer TonB [Acidobacteriota bacterium]